MKTISEIYDTDIKWQYVDTCRECLHSMQGQDFNYCALNKKIIIADIDDPHPDNCPLHIEGVRRFNTPEAKAKRNAVIENFKSRNRHD